MGAQADLAWSQLCQAARIDILPYTMPAKTLFMLVVLSLGARLGNSCDTSTVVVGTCGNECIAAAGQSCSDCSSTNICCASGTCHMGGTCAAGNCIAQAG